MREALRWKWHRVRGSWRCKVGIHRLRGHIDCGDGVNVAPYDARISRPARGAWRICNWCGARWVAAYDGIAPFWQRQATTTRVSSLSDERANSVSLEGGNQ